jgi:hypothetical protein
MTPEKLQPNFEEEQPSFEIFSPTQEDFETLPIERLHALWEENHKKLKRMLETESPPYFGLHGTSQKNFRQIETGGSCFVEIATFYEKEYESEQFLYKLYQAALYVSAYANKKDQPGRIMVFNLEKKGRNITNKWERLASGNSFETELFCDSDEESKHFSDLRKEAKENPLQNDLLFRSDLSLQGEDFSERFYGSIDFSDDKLIKYVSNPKDLAHIVNLARIILKSRFLSQEIIAQTLKLIIKDEADKT